MCLFLRYTEGINYSSESQVFFIFVLFLLEMRCMGPGKWRQRALLSFVIKREAVDVNVKRSVGPQRNKVVCMMQFKPEVIVSSQLSCSFTSSGLLESRL